MTSEIGPVYYAPSADHEQPGVVLSSLRSGILFSQRLIKLRESACFENASHAFWYHPCDFDKFDLIIAMDIENRTNLHRLSGSPQDSAKIHLMREFDPLSKPDSSVPDPYYGGIDGFEKVFKIVERSCQGLLDALESGQV